MGGVPQTHADSKILSFCCHHPVSHCRQWREHWFQTCALCHRGSYSSETFQWHTAADPLPVPCWIMTSVTIADTWYQLGGNGADEKDISTVLYAPLTTLIQKAISPTHQSASHTSVWKTLPDTPINRSAAASLSGSLLAVGGYNDKIPSSPALYVFSPLTNSWVRTTSTTGDLPEPRWSCTAVQLSSNQLLVVGGRDEQDRPTNTVFLGTITT